MNEHMLGEAVRSVSTQCFLTVTIVFLKETGEAVNYFAQ